MKNFSLLSILSLFVLTLTHFSSDETKDIAYESIIGRWLIVGFDEEIRYEFTSNKLFTLYADGSGVFPTLEEFIQQNPKITGLNWY